jgi:inhibitor of cysteine peptidase
VKKILLLIFILLFVTACAPQEVKIVHQVQTEFFNPDQTQDLDSFATVEEAIAFIAANAQGSNSGNFRTFDTSMPMMAESASDGAAVKNSGSYSETNVQVQGIDEGDIIKTNGDIIVTVSGQTVFILKAGKETQITSKLTFNDTVSALFLEGNTLAVLTTQWSYDYDTSTSSTTITTYNVQDPNYPVKQNEASLEGSYSQSRMIGNTVYLITQSSPAMQTLPFFSVGTVRESISPRDVFIAPWPYDRVTYANILTFDIETGNVDDTVSLAVDNLQTVYMSENAIYAVSNKYINEWEIRQTIFKETVEPTVDVATKRLIAAINEIDSRILSEYEKESKVMNLLNKYVSLLSKEDQESLEKAIEGKLKKAMDQYEFTSYTVITKVDVTDGQLEPTAIGSIGGTLVNQFSLDEYDSVLRTATTVTSKEDRETSSVIYTLDEDLEVIDSVTDIAQGERIFSTRFVGERLYMVTFRQIDPFFVVDLSDASSIEILGELKIPGFSRYLHPYDKDTIIGLGQEADEDGRTTGLKISLFDVSDVTAPIETAKFVTKEKYARSSALFEHKAFLFDKEKELLVIPAYSNNYDDDEGYNGALVFAINKTDVTSRGLIDHSVNVAQGAGKYRYYWQPVVERSLFIDDLLYTKSFNLLRVNELDTLAKVVNVVLVDVEDEPIQIEPYLEDAIIVN